MPNRVIRSGFLDSDKINSLKAEEQLFFIRLMLIVDDFGCFDGRIEMIKSYAYPVSNVRLTDVSKWLSAVCKADLVALYEEAGKKFLFIKNFDQRLRQKKRKFPNPNNLQEMSVNCQTDDGQLHATMPESESEKNPNPNPNPNKKVCFAPPLHLIEAWPDFVEMRKKLKAPLTDRASKGIVKELENLSPRDNDTQIKILERSITNSYRGVFPLPQQNSGGSKFGPQVVTNEALREQAKKLVDKGVFDD